MCQTNIFFSIFFSPLMTSAEMDFFFFGDGLVAIEKCVVYNTGFFPLQTSCIKINFQ